MGMDDEWKKVYDSRAKENLPEHYISCWTKEGFEELLIITQKLVIDLSKKLEIKKILDVGTGPGIYANKLSELGFIVTGIDYSENVIELAKNKFPNLDLRVGNGYNLEFSDKSYDLVLSIGTLQCLYDHEKFINELIRVSGKAIIISTLLRRKKLSDPIRYLHKELENDSWPTRDYHPSEITEILEKNGFKCELIFENNGQQIRDGYFIIAIREDF